MPRWLLVACALLVCFGMVGMLINSELITFLGSTRGRNCDQPLSQIPRCVDKLTKIEPTALAAPTTRAATPAPTTTAPNNAASFHTTHKVGSLLTRSFVPEIANCVRRGATCSFTWNNHSHTMAPVRGGETMTTDLIVDTIERWTQSTIVTGFSSNHLEEALPFLRQAALQTPMNLVIYDLSTADQDPIDPHRIRQAAPGAIVRSYPLPVAEIKRFAWKPKVVANELRRVDGGFVVWGDASTRLVQGRCLLGLFLEMDASGTIVSGRLTVGTVAQYTHPESLACMQVSAQDAGKLQVVAATNLAFGADGLSFAQQWDFSSNGKGCIAPKGSRAEGCSMSKSSSQTKWLGCHRFDQSVLSILFASEHRAQLPWSFGAYITTCRRCCRKGCRSPDKGEKWLEVPAWEGNTVEESIENKKQYAS